MITLTNKHKLQLFGAVLAMVCVFAVGGGRAEAATINVGGSCSLNSAISSLNTGSDSGSCTSTGAYGTNDTINIPAGTQTLTGNLPPFETGGDVTVQGAGKTSTTIDADGFIGFSDDENDNANFTYIFKDFKIENAVSHAIYLTSAKGVTLDSLDVTNSVSGIEIGASSVTITNSNIHDNLATTSNAVAGARISMQVIGSDDTPDITIENTKFQNNTGKWAGGLVIGQAGVDVPTSSTVTIDQVEVLNNNAEMRAGVTIGADAGDAPVNLSISATTIANNFIVTEENLTNANVGTNARIAGLLLSVVNLQPGMHLSNTTVANNTVTNNTDNQASIAGFFSVAIDSDVPLSQINTTVVGNTVVHPGIDNAIGPMPAFALLNVDVDTLTIIPGGSAQNSLIMNNTTNGVTQSCRNDFPGAFIGIGGAGDLTPINNGNNVTDDQNCTDYDYQAGLAGTVGDLEYNGGNVQTMALLPGSPAIGAGGNVLGISTDARGIARPANNPDAGAYQSVLGDATDPESGSQGGAGDELSDTGVNALIISVVALAVLVGSVVAIRKTAKK